MAALNKLKIRYKFKVKLTAGFLAVIFLTGAVSIVSYTILRSSMSELGSIEEISSSATALSDMADKLKATIQRFQV